MSLGSYCKDGALGFLPRYGNHYPYLPDTTHSKLHSSKVSAIALLAGIYAIHTHIHGLHIALNGNMGMGEELLGGRVHNLQRKVGWSRDRWRVRRDLECDLIGTSLSPLDRIGGMKERNDRFYACAYEGYGNKRAKAKDKNQQLSMFHYILLCV